MDAKRTGCLCCICTLNKIRFTFFAMTIHEVKIKRDLYDFIYFPLDLYSGCKYFVPPLHSQEFATLSQDKNPAFSYCDAKLWTVKEGEKIVGRIAGIINKHENESSGKDLVARFGWLDFKDSFEVAKLLLDTVEKWAITNHARTIHGPLGFTSFDKSGILIEGYDELPTSVSSYNYPYYASAMEKLGYKKEFDWVEYNIKVPDEVPQKITKGAELVKQRYGLELVPLKNTSEIAAFKDKAFQVLIESYSGLSGFTKLSREQFHVLFDQFKHLIIPAFTAIIKDKNSKIIGFGFAIPSLSKALIKMKGKFFPFGIWHFYKAKYFNDTVDLVLLAIKPEYQKKGAHALIFNKIMKNFQRKGIRYVESNKELDGNNNIKNLWMDYDLRQHKRSRCYIKQIG